MLPVSVWTLRKGFTLAYGGHRANSKHTTQRQCCISSIKLNCARLDSRNDASLPLGNIYIYCDSRMSLFQVDRSLHLFCHGLRFPPYAIKTSLSHDVFLLLYAMHQMRFFDLYSLISCVKHNVGPFFCGSKHRKLLPWYMRICWCCRWLQKKKKTSSSSSGITDLWTPLWQPATRN